MGAVYPGPAGFTRVTQTPAATGDSVDVEFLDPADCYYVYGQPTPAPQGHSGYWADPRVWQEINRVAAGLADGAPSSGNGPTGGTRASGPSQEFIQGLVKAPQPSAVELAMLTAGQDSREAAGGPASGAGELAPEETVTAGGDEGETSG